jgi:hypothetical protein
MTSYMTGAPGTVSDDEIAACAPNGAVRTASGTLIGAGFLTLFNGIQLVTSLRFYDMLLQASLYAMIGVGAAAMFVGVRLYRMTGWAAPASLGLAALLSLAMGAWFVFAVRSGLFTLFGLLAPIAAFPAVYFAYRAGPAVRRAAEIRGRLQDAGIELGF